MTQINAPPLRLDPHNQTVIIGGRQTTLRYKSWRVLTALIDAAPGAVKRSRLIDDIWSGNHDVGDRALNHALWTIRAALGDSAKRPAYIRTIPREGYQWIGPSPAPMRHAPIRTLNAAGLAASLTLVAAIIYLQADAFLQADLLRAQENHRADAQDNRRIVLASSGSRAFFSGRDLVLENLEGCQYIFKARPETTFSRPVFSDDGAQMAFRAQQAEGCKLVIFKVGDSAPQVFDACPTIDRTGLDIPTLT